MKIKRLLSIIWYYLTSPEYRIIKRSMLFDPEYYLESYPDVALGGNDPVVHYLKTGANELRSPYPYFHQDYYLRQISNLPPNENPLCHYLRVGRLQNLRPNPLVDPLYYTLHKPDFTMSDLDPVSHFLKNCKKEQDCLLSPYFDSKFYCRKYPDVRVLENDPAAAYRHFLTVGFKEHRKPSLFFDPDWYLDKAPILQEKDINPISHYFSYGIEEKKSASPLFDPEYYLQTGGANDEKDPFAHYLRFEPTASRRPCAWFDPVFYRRQYLVADSAESPLGHYLEHGLHEKAYPNGEVAALAIKPVISVVVPVYNVVPAYLNNCIRSVLYQSYPHWEICLADDCSTDSRIRPLLEQWAATDSRITVVWLDNNSGISGATNAAASLATGEYLAFLDNDDELALDALFSFVRAITNQGGDLLYCDEDLIGADGRQFNIFRKPDFNRELLLCHNYVTHCVVVKRSLFIKVGGCDSRMDGAQDHDLFLKLAEQAKKIVHLPEILYHWRASETSTSINHTQKEYAHEAGRKSVTAALVQKSIAATVENTELNYFYRVHRQILQGKSVTVLIDWRRPIGEFGSWLSRLVTTAGYPLDQVMVTVEFEEWIEDIEKAGREAAIAITAQVVPGKSPAATYNHVAHHIRSEFVAIVDSLLEITSDGWLAALLGYGQHREVGMVGGRVEYSPQLGEVTPIPDCSNDSPLYFSRFLANGSVLMNGLQCPQEVRSITGEICLFRTTLLRETGGFNAMEYPSLLFIQDLALRLRLQGSIHIYTPYCTAILKDSKSNEPQTLAQEKARFQENWATLLNQGDPLYNTGLLLDQQLPVDDFYKWLTGNINTETPDA